MGRIGFGDLDRFGGNGGGGSFFKLVNDKDEAHVRIMLNKLEDLENGFMFSCHMVKVPDSQYDRPVACLRNYNDPVEDCPFCAAGKKPVPKIYIPLYNEDAEEVQIWDRGKGFMQKFTAFCSRYSKPSIVAHAVTIERNGKSGDLHTTYELYMDETDDTTLEDLPELPTVLGTAIMDKTAEDMEYYLEAGEFPPDDEEDEKPVRRRSSRKEEPEEEEEVPFEEEKPRRRHAGGRRTPARGGDKF